VGKNKKKRNTQDAPFPERPAGAQYKTKRSRAILVIGAALVLGAAFIGVIRLTSAVAPSPEESSFRALGVQLFDERPSAPDFTLRRMNGSEVRLADLKGKVIFLNFWATWCTPCRWEMPEIEAMYQNFKDEGFDVVAVSIDATPDPIEPFARSMNLTFPIAHDPGMAVARRYGFRGPPLSFFIDRKGRIVGGASGPRNWNGPLAQNLVKKLLAEPAA